MLLTFGRFLILLMIRFIDNRFRIRSRHSMDRESHKCKNPSKCSQLHGKPDSSKGWCNECVVWAEQAASELFQPGEISWEMINIFVRHRFTLEGLWEMANKANRNYYIESRMDKINDDDAANILSFLSTLRPGVFSKELEYFLPDEPLKRVSK